MKDSRSEQTVGCCSLPRKRCWTGIVGETARVPRKVAPANGRGVSCYHCASPTKNLQLMTLALLADELVKARQSGQLVETNQHPTDLPTSYALQAAVTRATKNSISGYKIGATAVETQELLGLSEPFFAPLLSGHLLTADASNTTAYSMYPQHAAVIECEFVVGLNKKLIRNGRDVTVEDVAAATEWVAPGFELVGTRFASAPHKGFCAIADNGNNIAVVTGARSTDWTTASLSDHAVSLSINGNSVAQGHSGVSVAGHPFAMLAWLVNHSEMRARGLNAGEFVYTGTCTGAAPVTIGDEICADYGSLGEIRLRLVAASS